MISRLIAGRAGELTNTANKITFSLLEFIFGQNGPYRNALKEFGVKIVDTSESYLVLKDSQVLTDISKEQKILWGNYPIELLVSNNQVIPTFSWKRATPARLINYINKAATEGHIIASVDHYLIKCRQMYKETSEKVVHITQQKELTLKDFGSIYKDIIYISYLYELLTLYKAGYAHQSTYKDYIQKNDYLFADNQNFIEFKLKLPNGFYLDDYKNLQSLIEDAQGLSYIPARIDDLNNPEIVLQCLKNNLRVKTNVLLFFLNITAQQKAHVKGFESIADLDITGLI